MKITSGRKRLSHLLLIHGMDGVGKTTLASEFPEPIFIGPELGSFNIDCKRYEGIETIKDFVTALKEVQDLGLKAHKTIVIDSLDWVQMIIEKYTDEKFEKSYEALLDMKKLFIKVKDLLNVLRVQGFNIVLICHSTIAEFNDPGTDSPYNRYELKLYKAKNNIDIRALWREFVDAVIFLQRETFTTSSKIKKNVRASSTGVIKMHLSPDARWDAKNRFGITEDVDYELGKGYVSLKKLFTKEG